jgi:hypothetical protein
MAWTLFILPHNLQYVRFTCHLTLIEASGRTSWLKNQITVSPLPSQDTLKKVKRTIGPRTGFELTMSVFQCHKNWLLTKYLDINLVSNNGEVEVLQTSRLERRVEAACQILGCKLSEKFANTLVIEPEGSAPPLRRPPLYTMLNHVDQFSVLCILSFLRLILVLHSVYRVSASE